jgi:hypothetical protein
VSAVEGRTGAEGVRELGAEQDIEIKVEVTGDWRKLHNELHYLYCTLYVGLAIRSMRMGLVETWHAKGRKQMRTCFW